MSKDPSVLLLEHHLKALKLPSFLRDYPNVAAVCGRERADYPTYLLRLAERELIDRGRRATERERLFAVVRLLWYPGAYFAISGVSWQFLVSILKSY